MQSKSLLIAIAAFAVTATGVSAYNGGVLQRAKLSDDQRSAIAEAHELRVAGDTEAARDRLVEAGIDEDALRALHRAKHENRSLVHEAIEAGDYDAFMEAAADSPLADIITTEADFAQLQEAHELRESGERAEARELMEELGIEPRQKHQRHHHMSEVLAELSDEQREALRVAKEANDRATIQAIFDEAGVEHPSHRR